LLERAAQLVRLLIIMASSWAWPSRCGDKTITAQVAVLKIGKQTAQWCGLLQVVDDILDFTSRQSFLGKPALTDVKAGVITCPVLFAAEEHPGLVPMIKRKFKCDGDVEYAVRCVLQSDAIARSQDLARSFVAAAASCIDDLGPCPSEHARQARDALRGICEKVRCRVSEAIPTGHL
jgi:geranylgeranyl pyrophosphate synthase